LYRAEVKLRTIFSYFTGFAIFIACLGLFGLASFTAEQRTKEIGIRKVLGSSIVGILFLLIKEFTKWVVVANIVAWPLAYFALHRWLQHFAYRTEMSLWMFLLSGVLALMIALITVGYQAVKAARANPVMSLRYE
jgi:putative ABC transport system permease protein